MTTTVGPPLPEQVKPYPVIANIDFAEGPIFDRDGNLYFVNYVENGCIGKWDRLNKVSIWIKTDGLLLGLKVDAEGRIVGADYGKKRIVRFNSESREMEVLASEYDAGPLNGPNDLCFDLAGNLYFTDPGDNFTDPIGQVFCLDVEGQLVRLDQGLRYPNGIAVSPDQQKLFVSETVTQRILAYDIIDGRLDNRHVLFEFEAEGVDGMMFDEFGRLWVARWKNGTVDCLSTQGKLIGSLDAGGHATNLCWWEDAMYVTVADRHSVHRLNVGFSSAPQIPKKAPQR